MGIKCINAYKEVRTKPGTCEVQHRCDKYEPSIFLNSLIKYNYSKISYDES